MKIDERGFEDAISGSLVESGGYRICKWGTKPEWAGDFDSKVGLDTAELLAFLEDTQPTAWKRLLEVHGGPDGVLQQFGGRLARQLDERGALDVLRHGVNDHGIEVRLAFFKPAHGLTPELNERYLANRLTVTRQLPYEAGATKTLDLCLFINGIPVATAELKNPLTHQTVEHAKHQYRSDRDPSNVTLARRALVHFVVDPELVETTTKLEGPNTRFLPFNRGNAGGRGNAPDPTGHRTRYLWEEIWARDAWLDLLGRFVHVVPGAGPTHAAQLKAGSVIFPRYHQWDAVRRLEGAARAEGPGQSYLVQHSAGSGKSNTIAWLSHRLMSLHGGDDKPVYAFGPLTPAPGTYTITVTVRLTDGGSGTGSAITARVFAIAWSNLDGVAGYQAGGKDVLIDELVDTNRDNVVSVGDTVIADRFPINTAASHFGTWGLTSQTVTDPVGDGAGDLSVGTATGFVAWEHNAVAEGAGFNEGGGGLSPIIVDIYSGDPADCIDTTEDIVYTAVDQPLDPSVDAFDQTCDVSDNTFIDVAIDVSQ